VPELGTPGSVRGVLSNGHPYRNPAGGGRLASKVEVADIRSIPTGSACDLGWGHRRETGRLRDAHEDVQSIQSVGFHLSHFSL
jgi:hypothetical protein